MKGVHQFIGVSLFAYNLFFIKIAHGMINKV